MVNNSHSVRACGLLLDATGVHIKYEGKRDSFRFETYKEFKDMSVPAFYDYTIDFAHGDELDKELFRILEVNPKNVRYYINICANWDDNKKEAFIASKGRKKGE